MASEKRLIDAKALKQYLKDNRFEFVRNVDFAKALEMIDCAPTVDAVEVVHGRWETPAIHLWRCSVCKIGVPYSFTGDSYCHNCGAKMDGERKDNEHSL